MKTFIEVAGVIVGLSIMAMFFAAFLVPAAAISVGGKCYDIFQDWKKESEFFL